MKSKKAKLGPLFQIALVSLVWLGIALLLATSESTSSRLSRVAFHSCQAGARFVFADLDGDRTPDLALVELQSPRSAMSNYSIHLKLSAGTESAIGVNAPIGGLRVAARDVNGDDNIDLILTSNLDAHFVEVLLNDGRGNFSLAAPGDFPELENQSSVLLHIPSGPLADRVTLGSIRYTLEEVIAQYRDHHQVYSSDLCYLPDADYVRHRVALSRSGRSPPSCVAIS